MKTVNRARVRGHPRSQKAFTLVEVLAAVAIVGVAFVCLLEAFKVGLLMLEQSQRMAIANVLAEEIHQRTLTLPLADPTTPSNWGLESGEAADNCDDVDDLDGQTLSPPINADGGAITGLSQYSQRVTVTSVADSNYNQVVGDGLSEVYRVTVAVDFQGTEVCRLSWLVFGL